MREFLWLFLLAPMAVAAESLELGVEVGVPRSSSHAQVGAERGRITWNRASQMAAVASWHPGGDAWMGVAFEHLAFSRNDGFGQRVMLGDLRLGIESSDHESAWRWSGCWQIAGGWANDAEGGGGGGAWALGARSAVDYRHGAHLLVGGWLSARWLAWQTETDHLGASQKVEVSGFTPAVGLAIAWNW